MRFLAGNGRLMDAKLSYRCHDNWLTSMDGLKVQLVNRFVEEVELSGRDGSVVKRSNFSD